MWVEAYQRAENHEQESEQIHRRSSLISSCYIQYVSFSWLLNFCPPYLIYIYTHYLVFSCSSSSGFLGLLQSKRHLSQTTATKDQSIPSISIQQSQYIYIYQDVFSVYIGLILSRRILPLARLSQDVRLCTYQINFYHRLPN